ncbi:MAG: (d)CMP kinase [Anaerolineae bacterium]
MKPTTIAIDGPAASGKSTVGAALAQHLGYLYFDTGVMYRAVTWAALQRGLNINDEAAITRLAETITIDVTEPTKADGRLCTVWCDSVDVSWLTRSPEVDANVSPVSAYPGVRSAMTAQQRRIGLRGSVVMVGRDIGTVVLPEAPLKIYLDASVEERARRRFREMQARGDTTQSYDEILAAMKRRDAIDSGRATAPLKAAADAIRIDSTTLDVAQVIARVEQLMADA